MPAASPLFAGDLFIQFFIEQDDFIADAILRADLDEGTLHADLDDPAADAIDSADARAKAMRIAHEDYAVSCGRKSAIAGGTVRVAHFDETSCDANRAEIQRQSWTNSIEAGLRLRQQSRASRVERQTSIAAKFFQLQRVFETRPVRPAFATISGAKGGVDLILTCGESLHTSIDAKCGMSETKL
jgi:hypothetical protein